MNMLNNDFEILLADTTESREINYSIRYQVYCEEMGFENIENFPLEQEYDDNDQDGRSVHFIAKSKITGEWVGAMRLIFKQDTLLPIEESCKLDEKVEINDFYGAVEISRLCLVKGIRKRFKDIDPPHGIMDEADQQEMEGNVSVMHDHQKFSRMVLWGLLHAALEYGNSNKIMNSYFMTSKALARVLKRGGLNLISIGDACQHKGERFPFRMDTTDVYQSDAWKKEYSCGYSLYSDSADSDVGAVA